MSNELKYVFGAKNTKTETGYQIEFINIPKIYAKGTTYEETVYYSYRVLANFLTSLEHDPKRIQKYTLQMSQAMKPNKNVFYSIILADPSLDPHQMETSFILPQATAETIGTEATALSRLLNYQNTY
ncbi:hypothetical protein ACNAN0_05580 [Agrilactobacillus fermenti]|uniref:hypothetical protein n=1 Tax=Agrilactobacillus fermenti TaxID=2586909 RepID=UPI001E3FFB9F|nr:hypothetical protein [Agrilactobacillus fermenti]MCD2257463.1 hypothetical protein [Agrilactobacillus fermenti]